MFLIRNVRHHQPTNKIFTCPIHIYRPQRTYGKVMFLYVSVILSGGAVWHTHPWADPLPPPPPLWVDTPPGRHPSPLGRHPPPTNQSHCSRRCPSYWNAFLCNLSRSFNWRCIQIEFEWKLINYLTMYSNTVIKILNKIKIYWPEYPFFVVVHPHPSAENVSHPSGQLKSKFSLPMSEIWWS